LQNLANTYIALKEFDKALEALNDSKNYTERGNSQWYYYYINAGLIQQHKKNYALAKIQFDHAWLFHKEIKWWMRNYCYYTNSRTRFCNEQL